MGRRKKGSAEIPLALDSDGRTYKRDLGYEPDGKGGFKQPRFWLGTDRDQAAARLLLLEQAWQAVCDRWGREKATPRPVWDATTKAIAKAIAKGEAACRVDTVQGGGPPDQLASAMTRFVAAQIRVETAKLDVARARPGAEVRRLQQLQADFPMASLTLSDGQNGGTRFDPFEMAAFPNPPEKPTAPGQMLHAALDAFSEHVLKSNREGDAPTQHATRVAGMVRTLKGHHPDRPLASFDLAAIDSMLDHWKNLPMVNLGRTGQKKRCSPETAKNAIKRVREFIRWAHKSKEWAWRKPDDYEVLPVRIAEDYASEDTTFASEQVKKYTVDELARLWEYATPRERLYMVLALNCGFGAAEVASLKQGQIHLDTKHEFYPREGSFIARKRKKTGVYGEWSLWPVTVAAIRWYRSVRPASDEPYLILGKRLRRPLLAPTKGNNRNQAIPNAWDDLLTRVRKDHPAFPKRSFNKLRKTAGNAIRKIADGEIAGVFGGRGKPVKSDDQSERYGDRPFEKVFDAVQVWGERLSSVFASVAVPFPEGDEKSNPATSLGKIKEIRRLRGEGIALKEIARRTGVPFGTVRYHLDKKKPGSTKREGDAVDLRRLQALPEADREDQEQVEA